MDEDIYYTVSQRARRHILEKHSPHHPYHGNGTKFPDSWSNETIIQNIEQVANDPIYLEASPDGTGRTDAWGIKDNIPVHIVLGNLNIGEDDIITAFPDENNFPWDLVNH